jgi:hypothetical protein
MKPIFTVHAGEFVFAEAIEKRYPNLRIWMPTKDTGVDFLLTDEISKSAASVQVKMSRDYRPAFAKDEFDKKLKAAGWFVFSHSALECSSADVWSLILISHERKQKPIFLNIPPRILLERLIETHGVRKSYHLYPWVLDDGHCIEGRGMKRSDKRKYLSGSCFANSRDMSEFFENWSFAEALL